MTDTQNASSVAAFAKWRLTEMIPMALDKLKEAMDDAEPWAIKLLLDAAGFERIASQILGNDNNGERDAIISTAFERDIVERVLNVFRGDISTRGTAGNEPG